MSETAMDVARRYVEVSRRKRGLDAELAGAKTELDALEEQLLDLIESEQIPHSFKIDGATVFTRQQVWASPADKDHEALTEVLRELGMVEYLPSKVNSHSISAFVREHINPDTDEVEGLDPRLEAALKITTTTKCVVNG